MQRHAAADGRIRIVAHAQNEGMFFSLQESCDLSRGRYRVPIEADDWIRAPTRSRCRSTCSAEPIDGLRLLVDDDGRLRGAGVPRLASLIDGDRILPGEVAVEEILVVRAHLYRHDMRVDMPPVLHARLPRGVPHIADMLLGVAAAPVGDEGYIDRALYAFRETDQPPPEPEERDMVKRGAGARHRRRFDGPLGKR